MWKLEKAGEISIKAKAMKGGSSSNTLSIEELRNFFISYHSLYNYEHFSGKDGVKKIMQRLGTVQYDVLNMVGRNPDLVLQSRVKNYRAVFLEELLYRERFLADGWDKEMSIYLMSDWKNFSRIREQSKKSTAQVLNYRGQEEALQYLTQVINEIKKRGPLASREIKLGATEKHSWGHRQISGAAMDYLFSEGILGIHKKQNTQKIYDLCENLIPGKILNAPDKFKTEDDFLEWYFYRRIGSLGAALIKNGTAWLGYFLGDSTTRRRIFKTLEEKKKIIPMIVPELNEVFYIQNTSKVFINSKTQYDGIARFLAPLDNLLWDRAMIRKVFNFEYSWEVYVPQAKRKYGYYVLPVLYKNKLIARVEFEKYNKGKPLSVKNWWWEKYYSECNKKIKSEINSAVKRGLLNFANYLEAEGVEKESLSLPFA